MSLTMFGHPARVLIDLPDGPHDVSHLVEVEIEPAADAPLSGFRIRAARLLGEIEIECRARERHACRVCLGHGATEGCPECGRYRERGSTPGSNLSESEPTEQP